MNQPWWAAWIPWWGWMLVSFTAGIGTTLIWLDRHDRRTEG